MSRKIIRPAGLELLHYINEGYPICGTCGALMDLKIHSESDYRYVCPGCGHDIDTSDYQYDSPDEWTPQMEELIGSIKD